MAAPFSRLQLAAALLEYDNDPSDPSAPYRSAHESAIFAHLRRHPARPHISQRKSDYLSVALPSETDSVLDGGKRKSRASTIGPLRNPFSADDLYEEEHEEHDPPVEAEMEMDLTSWGLDAFMSKEKSSKGKGKGNSLSSAPPLSAVQAHFPKTNDSPGVQHRPRATRSMSVGNNYDFLSPAEDMRRKSIGSPLDLSGMDITASFHRPAASTSQSAYDGIAEEYEEPGMGSIPFPTAASVRSPSPMTLDMDKHRRTYSTASIDSKMAMNNVRLRTTSNGTIEPEDNMFALAPPSRASKFDPKAAAHARTMSTASLGSRILLDNDGNSVMMGRPPLENRYSTTMELLRPKVLVMPSPLQSANAPPPPPKVRDGFQLAEAAPLPPGARTSRRISTLGTSNIPVPSNSFTPNPRLNLSLSQLTFRNNLAVGGQRDVSYNDIDEGFLVQMATTPTMETEMPLPLSIPTEEAGPHRPAGKLYGKSLIDDLESRKALMKSKQRVFRGDDRPSMMARTPMKRASTLIDPTALQVRPGNSRTSSFEPAGGLARRNSVGPLVNFDGDAKVPPVAVNKGAPNRSVFGVDTLWEREMVKLREIEAQEAFERERQQAIEETEALKKGKKKKKKGKKGLEDDSQIQSVMSSVPEPSVLQETPTVSSGPPVLPIIQAAIRGPPPVIDDDASDSEESIGKQAAKSKSTKAEGWYEESSDEDRPRRTTGIGLRYPQKQLSIPHIKTSDDDSEEDVPLASTISRAVQRTTRLAAPDSDSDEEKPLSVLISKASLPSINFDSLSPPTAAANAEDDDDEPLGLRASRVIPSSSPEGQGEDDDRPLAFHPEQQRRTQYQMMAQHQQMMMQAQMHNSMFFNQSMSGFFPPPMVMQPMIPQAPIPIPSPPPIHDAAKYGRVDRWRHDVAIEDE
ncbi:hypothetical protein BDP27DRAFT_1314597 [Rhodocollybia butyracea]|uniref:Uncharacterized protein n=1 Tax=Rhodocollybia butyracea TaxID=206335 RepID=A0A9P5UE41_9AGAR|nr:hypothetical protein BDP27DRAFT_1314597 [Rhodocollybia butyracea]